MATQKKFSFKIELEQRLGISG